MAHYQEITPDPNSTPAQIYTQIADLLVGACSVEVLPSGTSVILRVWFEQHCDPAQHSKIE